MHDVLEIVDVSGIYFWQISMTVTCEKCMQLFLTSELIHQLVDVYLLQLVDIHVNAEGVRVIVSIKY
jgi:hypothetical protein